MHKIPFPQLQHAIVTPRDAMVGCYPLVLYEAASVTEHEGGPRPLSMFLWDGEWRLLVSPAVEFWLRDHEAGPMP